MKMWCEIRTIFLVVLLSLSGTALHAEWTINELEVDGTHVKLALPSDYLKAPDDDAGLAYSRKILPEYFVFANYHSSKPWRYVQVQMYKAERDYRYTRESFLATIAQAKTQLPDLNPGEFRAEFQRRIDEITIDGLSLTNPVLFPISSESDRYYIIPVLMGMSAGSSTNSRVVVACASVAINLKGRNIMLQIFTPYENKGTVDQVATLAREVAELTLAANR